ncbi:hypothetical protein BaRGS_00020189, partial [Batillaria attramentaria]
MTTSHDLLSGNSCLLKPASSLYGTPEDRRFTLEASAAGLQKFQPIDAGVKF